MHRHSVPLLALVCLAAAKSSIGQAPMESHERFVCTGGGEQRVVSILIRPANGDKRQSLACRVDYTKGGKTQTLWASQSDRAYCTAKAIALVTKLNEGRYACKPEALVKPDEAVPAE